MNVTGRINRILFILSFVSQNQGIHLEALASKVGMRPRALIKELEFISLIGKPPFKPDDYVDIYVEDDRGSHHSCQILDHMNDPHRCAKCEGSWSSSELPVKCRLRAAIAGG